MNGVEKALTLVSLLDGVKAIEIIEDGSVHVYVDDVDRMYPKIANIMADHAPRIHGQVRGPNFPIGPLPPVEQGMH